MALKSYEELIKVDVRQYCEERDGFTYLNWAKCIELLRQNGATEVYWEPIPDPLTGSSLRKTDIEFKDKNNNTNRCYETRIKVVIDDKEYTKDGIEMDIRETQVPEYTFKNIASDDWIVADEKNCPELGGENTFSFGEAIKYLNRGFKVARKGWNGKGIYLEMYSPEVNLETIAEAVHNAWWEEKKKQGVTDHPDMIPYSELSEEVKEYDRVTARTTIEAFNYMTHSFIYINTTGLQTENPYAPKNKVPWTPSQTDMLAEDWVFAN